MYERSLMSPVVSYGEYFSALRLAAVGRYASSGDELAQVSGGVMLPRVCLLADACS
jgi:hypothetical protein